MNRKWIIVSALLATIVIVLLGFVVREAMQPQLKSFTLRYISGPEAADLVSGALPLGAVEGVNPGAVFIRASEADLLKAAEILQREDKPKPSVVLRFQIIEADGFTTNDSTIAAVENVLRGLFRFQGYRLVAEAFVRAKARTDASQTILGTDNQRYELNVVVHEVMRREGKASAEVRVELTAGGNRMLSTTVEVPDGQTVVLGTARVETGRGAIILVVTPEIR